MRNHKEQTTPVQELLYEESQRADNSSPRRIFQRRKHTRSFLFNACTVYVPVYRRLFFYFLCAVFIFSHNTCTIIRQKNTSHQGLLICSIFKSLQSFVFDIFLCFYNTVTCPFYIHVHVINTVHFTIAKTHGK